jgi:hypothetical protein
MSSSPSGNPTSKPSYNGGFYTKPASSSKAPAAVIGPPNPKDMAFDPNDGSPGEEQGAGMGEGANQAGAPQAGAQQGPSEPIATVPGPAASVVLVLVGALALVLLRRRAL